MFLVSEEGKDEEQVLKDHWVDEGRLFELFISEEILEYLRKYCGEDAAQLSCGTPIQPYREGDNCLSRGSGRPYSERDNAYVIARGHWAPPLARKI